ncbi:hypothetical protein BE17_19665 [Sorangium cellulosum]|uniref:Uncharacterized protein n=1 Tax=Sorangium cellulosum TaxID=56 RepID=A0A150SHH3_SORCE|nr:hypothetical protein BE17_19665 [Sorangium cellulosum]
MAALLFCSRRPLATLSRLLASALLVGGCGAEPEDTSGAALRVRFPDHAEAVLSAGEAFAPAVEGFRLGATEPGGAWVRAVRPEVVLPRDGSGEIRFRLAEGGEIRVRELGAFGEGRAAERAVSYGRAGGTSYWTAIEGGVEEWLLLEEGVARSGEVVAAWQVEGALLRERGAAVELVDEESGVPVLRVTAPRAHAASGRPVAAALRARGSRIELSVDMGDAGGEAVLVDPAWELVGTMNVVRSGHTATLLPNGEVLVAGGDNLTSAAGSAELYDPISDSWTLVAPMKAVRAAHTATLLPSGKVLVAGGEILSGALASAELYDPMTGTWTLVADMKTARIGHTATLLPGRGVLVTGGCESSGCSSTGELYDWRTDTWDPILPPMVHARGGHVAALLPSGKVLVVGGSDRSVDLAGAELYDPVAGTWTSTEPMRFTRDRHAGTLLPSGKVLVMGGRDGTILGSTAEVYDPESNTWALAGFMKHGHWSHTATLLQSGKVLVAGGNFADGRVGVDLYDPVSNAWTSAPDMLLSHAHPTATLLPSGEVLVAGESAYAERYTSIGAACRSDADCALSACVDGVCCDSPCTEPCHTCASSSALGRCVPQQTGSDLRKECAHTGCDGACDGFGACSAVPVDAACVPRECVDETHSLAPILCPADGATCPRLSHETREPLDCAPYRCAARDGACKRECASLHDCALGFVCDLSGSCVLPPPAGSRGCGVSPAAAVTSGNGVSALLLALLAIGQRRAPASRGGKTRQAEIC